jgi:hypothetical protein
MGKIEKKISRRPSGPDPCSPSPLHARTSAALPLPGVPLPCSRWVGIQGEDASVGPEATAVAEVLWRGSMDVTDKRVVVELSKELEPETK